MVKSKAISSTVQLSLFPCQGTGVKDNQNGSAIAAKYPTVSAYLKTPEALFRLIATYPPKMPLTEAIRRARIDFTKPVTCYQRDERKEVTTC